MRKKRPRLRHQPIRTQLDHAQFGTRLGGWLSGHGTYLSVYRPDSTLGWIEGQKLYRLAKAIVRQFEEGE